MEYEIEERPSQLGEDDAPDTVATRHSPQRDRAKPSRPSQSRVPNQDQALFIPEQEAGTG